MIGAPPPGSLPLSDTDPSGASIYQQAGDLLGFRGYEGDQSNLPNAGAPGGPLGGWMQQHGVDPAMHGYDFMGVPTQRPWLMPTPSPANEAMNQQNIQPVSASGNIAQMAQQVPPTVKPGEPGPAAQIPFGPVQGQLTLLPQFSSAGQTRPFGPGESIRLPNGMTANEMTWTIPMNGRWAVIPGLWLVNGQPTHLSADQAAEMAQKSGLQWPFMFDTEQEANHYAEHREDNWENMPQGPHMSTAQPPLWQPGTK